MRLIDDGQNEKGHKCSHRLEMLGEGERVMYCHSPMGRK
jgi:hypothetical protein